ARDGCRILVNKVFDLVAMARASLPEMWDSMEPDQHDIFRSAFAERMTTDCVRQITEHGTETLTLLGIRDVDGRDKFATARLGPEDSPKKIITWHLRSDGPELWVAIDMLADGRSIVLSAHDEYSAILQAQNGDIDALIAALQRP